MNNQGDLTGKCHKKLRPVVNNIAGKGYFEDVDLSVWNIPDVCLCFVRKF